VLGHEEIVRRALARLGGQLERAESRLGAGRAGDGSGDPRREVEALREALAAAGGRLEADELKAVAERVEALRFELGPELELDLTADRLGYVKRGLNSDDPAALYRLTLESLDRLDVALARPEGPGIQAEESRDPARDSAESAEYFRRLGSSQPE